MKPYTANPSAKLFHESLAKTKVLWGPIGSGKTGAALWEYFLMCLESEIGLDGVVIRSSYRELHDTTRKTFWNWFGEFSEYRERDDEAVMHLPSPSGKMLQHVLKFRAIQRPADTSKLLSLEPAFAFLEECVPAFSSGGVMGGGLSKEIYEIAFSRLRQDSAHRLTIVCTANPPPPSHWFYKHFVGATTDALVARNTVVVFQPPGENTANLPVNYYDELRATLDPDLVRRFVDGEVVTTYDGERVFPEAKDHYHVVDEDILPVPGRDLVLGFDWGLSPATLVTQIDPLGQWNWLKEIQSINSSADQHLELVRNMMKEEFPTFSYRSWGDPAGTQRAQTDAKTPFMIALSKGFPVKGGKQDWPSRKEAMKQRLQRLLGGMPALRVSRLGCPMAAEGLLGGYRYMITAGGNVQSRPLKNAFSHLQDAAQYIATGEFEITAKQPEKEVEYGRVIYIPRLDPLRPMVRGVGSGRSWMSS